MTAPAEDGTGLVELLVAAALGLLALGVVAAVARGPIAAATAAARPHDAVEGLLLLRDVIGGRVRAARASGAAGPVLAVGPDHLVLGGVLDDAVGWTRLSIAEGSLLLDGGTGPPPGGPSGVGRRLATLPRAEFVALDDAGAELGPADGDGAPVLAPGDPRLAAAAVIVLRVEVAGRAHDLAVALRPGP